MKKHILSITGAVCVSLMLTGCFNNNAAPDNTLGSGAASKFEIPADSSMLVSMQPNEALRDIVPQFASDLEASQVQMMEAAGVSESEIEALKKSYKNMENAYPLLDNLTNATLARSTSGSTSVFLDWKNLDDVNESLQKVIVDNTDEDTMTYEGTPFLQIIQMQFNGEDNDAIEVQTSYDKDTDTVVIASDAETTTIVDKGSQQYIATVISGDAVEYAALAQTDLYDAMNNVASLDNTFMSIAFDLKDDMFTEAQSQLPIGADVDASYAVIHLGMNGTVEDDFDMNAVMEIGLKESLSDDMKQMYSSQIESMCGEGEQPMPQMGDATFSCNYTINDEKMRVEFFVKSLQYNIIVDTLNSTMGTMNGLNTTTSMQDAAMYEDLDNIDVDMNINDENSDMMDVDMNDDTTENMLGDNTQNVDMEVTVDNADDQDDVAESGTQNVVITAQDLTVEEAQELEEATANIVQQ